MLFDIENISFFNNININTIYKLNNENSINNNYLTSFEPNNFFSISDENSLYNKDDNYTNNLARIIIGIKSGSKTRRYFKTRVEI